MQFFTARFARSLSKNKELNADNGKGLRRLSVNLSILYQASEGVARADTLWQE